VPLPDLKPVNIKVFDLPGNAKKQVCMAVQNVEVVHAGPFEVALKVNNQPVPNGRYTVGLLASGTHFDACVNVALPTSGRYKLSAAVDEARAVTEFNEANNLYETLYEASGPAGASTEPSTAPTPTSVPNAAEPDLVVTAIKVNGSTPDGKDDCKDGKNAVTVLVKNQGPTKAGDFFVRLVVDGGGTDAVEQLLADGLHAGTETPITFEAVRLKKGSHSLAATADAQAGVAESNETNNTRTATASCKDD
jgi:subtilase family serine protease